MTAKALQVEAFVAIASLATFVMSTGAATGASRLDTQGADEPLTLVFGNSSHGVPEQLRIYAEEVSARTDGTVVIEFHDGWHHNDANFESENVADLLADEVDMTWVGARIFDELGMDSFQALLAPLLVDSHDLQAAVFAAGIPDEMLAGVDSLGVVGLAVLPGPMRKILGVDHPFIVPDDFAGQVVGIQQSQVADLTMAALGATSRVVQGGAKLIGLDGYEQQFSLIAGNDYQLAADYVTANLNLWPVPSVVLISENALESLTAPQRRALRDAGIAAQPGALAAARDADQRIGAFICGSHMTTAIATDDQLATLREAVEPVYDELRSDEATAGYLERIEAFKADLGAPPDGEPCATEAAPGWPGATIPDGTYTRIVTSDDVAELHLRDDATGLLGDDRVVEVSLRVDGANWSLYHDGTEVDRGDSFYDRDGRWVRRSDRCTGCVWVLEWGYRAGTLSFTLVPNHAYDYTPDDILWNVGDFNIR